MEDGVGRRVRSESREERAWVYGTLTSYKFATGKHSILIDGLFSSRLVDLRQHQWNYILPLAFGESSTNDAGVENSLEQQTNTHTNNMNADEDDSADGNGYEFPMDNDNNSDSTETENNENDESDSSDSESESASDVSVGGPAAAARARHMLRTRQGPAAATRARDAAVQQNRVSYANLCGRSSRRRRKSSRRTQRIPRTRVGPVPRVFGANGRDCSSCTDRRRRVSMFL